MRPEQNHCNPWGHARMTENDHEIHETLIFISGLESPSETIVRLAIPAVRREDVIERLL